MTGVSVCMSVLGTITLSLCICHLAIKLYCIVLHTNFRSGSRYFPLPLQAFFHYLSSRRISKFSSSALAACLYQTLLYIYIHTRTLYSPIRRTFVGYGIRPQSARKNLTRNGHPSTRWTCSIVLWERVISSWATDLTPHCWHLLYISTFSLQSLHMTDTFVVVVEILNIQLRWMSWWDGVPEYRRGRGGIRPPLRKLVLHPKDEKFAELSSSGTDDTEKRKFAWTEHIYS